MLYNEFFLDRDVIMLHLALRVVSLDFHRGL